jgi:hypothetical protein
MLHAERAGSTLGGSAGEVNAKKTEGVGAETPERLTSMSHGGGCGCKISPKVLDSILARMPEPQLPLGMPKGDGSRSAISGSMQPALHPLPRKRKPVASHS